MLRVTTGDQYRVECPACGAAIVDLWDRLGGFEQGESLFCPHCEHEVIILSVDTVIEISLTEKTEEPKE
jgi:DNA-directed RNA polymerase subunit RPC12/RpoP